MVQEPNVDSVDPVDSRSPIMFVMPITRSASHRTLVPAFGRSLDRLFEESRARSSEAPALTPAMDVSESDTHYTVVLDMPGVTREQLKVSIEGRRVSAETVAAAAPAEPVATEATAAVAQTPKPAARVLYRERSEARYARTVSLPTEVDQTTSQAKLENGVLTLTLAKKVATGATQLSVS
jgi:HSP20 family protein